MTRQFNQTVQCPACGHSHSPEVPFKQWIRNEPELDSVQHGLVVMDCDQIVHRYKTHTDKLGTRDVQCLMIIEVKTHGAKVTLAQRDTLSLLSQLLNNMRDTPTYKSTKRRANDKTRDVNAHSHMIGRSIRVFSFGAFLLTMSGDCPETSEWIKWDNKDIDIATLIRILRFDLNPVTLQEMDFRRHHAERVYDMPLFSFAGAEKL